MFPHVSMQRILAFQCGKELVLPSAARVISAGWWRVQPPAASVQNSQRKKWNFLLDKQGGEGGDVAGYSLSTTPYLKIFFFFLHVCYCLKSPTVKWCFYFIPLTDINVICGLFLINRIISWDCSQPQTMMKTQYTTLKSEYIFIVCFFNIRSNLKKTYLNLKAARDFAMFNMNNKKNQNHKRSLAFMKDTYSLVLAVKGSVWKCCRKLETFISSSGSKNPQNSVSSDKLWLVWWNPARTNWGHNK